MKPRTQKTALVTGASGGIGNAIAECFARDGHDLVITARNAQALAAIAADWSSRYGVRVTPFTADLARADGAQRLADEVAASGIAIDFLVNNAGYGLFGEFTELRLEDELAMMTLNMTSLTVLTKRFLAVDGTSRLRIRGRESGRMSAVPTRLTAGIVVLPQTDPDSRATVAKESGGSRCPRLLN